MEGLRFTILLPPSGQKRARNRAVQSEGRNFSMTYKDKGQRLEEEKLVNLLFEHRPPVPFSGPLAFGLRAYLPVPKSKSKKFRAAALAGEIRPTKKPDLDNLVKNIKDVLKGAFWTDDALVVEYLPGTGKYYGDPARWEIEIRSWVPEKRWRPAQTVSSGAAQHRGIHPELFGCPSNPIIP